MTLKNFNFTAVFIEDPKGGYSAYVEEILGANAQGDTLEEARSNLMEALQMVLETNKILAQKSIISHVNSIRESLSFA